MSDPFKVVRDFEAALCEYTGAPYCVTVTSCTMALLLAVAWHMRKPRAPKLREYVIGYRLRPRVEIPERTYVGVPQSIIHAGGSVMFREEYWNGWYRLKPFPIWDSARWLTYGLYTLTVQDFDYDPSTHSHPMICLSFHHTKTLGLASHGGAILLDDPEAAAWLRKARFDGRTEGVDPREDNFDVLGYHCYMTPATAAEGLMRLATLPKHNAPLPNSDYPDLSKIDLFK